MMKTLLISLALSSTLLVSCDKQTLDGLNVKFQGNIQSDYHKDKSDSPQQSPTTEPKAESSPSSQVSRETQPSREVKSTSESDSDQSLPFNPLKSCSQGGIVAQTNEEFYQQYPEIKSIDSKDKELTKEWKAIKANIEKKCTDKP